MRSDADDVEAYLASLPEDRRTALSAVRDAILARLPDGYEETMAWGMICYQVPMERSGPTYNGKPLVYAGLASQKRHMSLYLTGVYLDEQALERFTRRYRSTGKRLDMGKSCVRFRTVEDLPLELVAETIAAMDPDTFVGASRAARGR